MCNNVFKHDLRSWSPDFFSSNTVKQLYHVWTRVSQPWENLGNKTENVKWEFLFYFFLSEYLHYVCLKYFCAFLPTSFHRIDPNLSFSLQKSISMDNIDLLGVTSSRNLGHGGLRHSDFEQIRQPSLLHLSHPETAVIIWPRKIWHFSLDKFMFQQSREFQ